MGGGDDGAGELGEPLWRHERDGDVGRVERISHRVSIDDGARLGIGLEASREGVRGDLGVSFPSEFERSEEGGEEGGAVGGRGDDEVLAQPAEMGVLSLVRHGVAARAIVEGTLHPVHDVRGEVGRGHAGDERGNRDALPGALMKHRRHVHPPGMVAKGGGERAFDGGRARVRAARGDRRRRGRGVQGRKRTRRAPARRPAARTVSNRRRTQRRASPRRTRRARRVARRQRAKRVDAAPNHLTNRPIAPHRTPARASAYTRRHHRRCTPHVMRAASDYDDKI